MARIISRGKGLLVMPYDSLPTILEPTLTFPSGFKLVPGLYLVTAARAKGKTTMLIALANTVRRHAIGKARFISLLEPRAPSQPALEGVESKESFVDAFAKLLAEQPVQLLIIDSITMLIPRIGASVLGAGEDTTYPGGIRLSDFLGVGHIDRMAERSGVTVFGSVNTDIYPKASLLEAACEGNAGITPTGFRIRDRVARATDELAIDERDIAAAREYLGYPVS